MKYANLKRFKELYDDNPDRLRRALEAAEEELEQFRDIKNPKAQDLARMEEIIDLIDFGTRPGGADPRSYMGQPDATGGGPFRSLGEQAIAVAQAATTGGRRDPRLDEVQERATGLTGQTPSEGGFLLQDAFSTEIISSIFTPDSLPGKVRRFPMDPKFRTLKIPGVDETDRSSSRFGGIISYLVSEGGTKTASKPKFRLLEFNTNKLVALVYSTDELLQSAPALDAFLRVAVQQEFSYMVSKFIISGSGSGQPLGIRNSGALIEVAKEGTQAGDTIVYENIINMVSRLQPVNEKSVCWIANRDVIPQLYQMYLAVGSAGVAVFAPSEATSRPPSLMGYPIVYSEFSPTLGDANDIMLCDLSCYGWVDKPTQFASSIHVSFVTDETCFRFVYQMDGMPLYAAPVTPAVSATTLSPFVGLAERT